MLRLHERPVKRHKTEGVEIDEKIPQQPRMHSNPQSLSSEACALPLCCIHCWELFILVVLTLKKFNSHRTTLITKAQQRSFS